MKRKALSSLVVLVLVTSGAIAQSAQIKAGINLANVTVSNDGRIDDSKQITSFNVGLIGDFPLIKNFLSVQPGIVYTGKGAKTQAGDESSGQYYRATSNPYYVEVPVNLVVKLPLSNEGGFFVGAGPYIAMGVAGKNKKEGKFLGVAFKSEDAIKFSNDDPTTTDYQEGAGFGIMRRFDYGLNGTAGFETKTFVLGLNYGLGLAKLQSRGNSSANDDNKHRVLSFSVGLKL